MTAPCVACGHVHGWARCPACGTPVVSADADSLDLLVQRASVPNLASLYRKGKDSGLIQAVSNYGEGAPSS